MIINYPGLEIMVTQQLLDGSDNIALFEKMGGIAVS